MKFEQYQFKFYLNANHAIEINGHLGQIHPHTWEISIATLKLSEKFISFHDVEIIVEKIFEKYQDKFLNKIPPFDRINPTLENICEVFKDKISSILEGADWKLLKIEVSETPARSYVISLSGEDDFTVQVPNTAELDPRSKEALITEIINECHHRSTIDSL